MSSLTVFLSDLHIGTSAETNWFQRDLHTELIKSVLDFVMQNSEIVKDVVVLGDWFEFWNYPPESTIPTLEEVFARNPSLFSRSKDKRDFISVMEAINGNFRFINGEHDMLVRLQDLNSLFSRYTDKKVLPGHGNSVEKDPIANTYYNSGHVWAEHGNQHDLFNRPVLSDQNACRPLPFGYFLSRLFCFYLEKQISSMHRRDASCLSGCSGIGEKSLGMKAEEFFDEIIRKSIKERGFNSAQILLENLLSRNRSFEIEFNMKTEGFSEIHCSEVPDYFSGLISSDDLFESMHEAEVAYSGLGRFAQRHFCENPFSRVVIMGHTHHSRLEILGNGKPRVYVNNGYLCPSEKDMESGEQLPSFTVVKEVGSNQIEIRQKFLVGKTFEVIDGPGIVLES